MYNIFLNYVQAGIVGSIIILLYIPLRKFINKRFVCLSVNIWLLIFIIMLVPFKYTIEMVSKEPNASLSNLSNSKLVSIVNKPEINIENSNISLEGFIVLLWIIGMGIMTFKYVKANIHLKGILKQSFGGNIHIEEMLDNISRELKIKKKLKIVENVAIGTPFVAGIIKPKIYLTTFSYTDEELAWIIRHELIHYKRSHLLYKFMAKLVNIVFWYNPLSYKLDNYVDEDCERACDEEVLKNSTKEDIESYLKTLASDIIYRIQSGLELIMPFNDKEALEIRINNIRSLSNKKSANYILIIGIILTALSFLNVKIVQGEGIEENKLTLQSNEVDNKVSSKESEEVQSLGVESLSKEEFENTLRSVANNGIDNLKNFLEESNLDYTEKSSEFVSIFIVEGGGSTFKVNIGKSYDEVGVREI